RWRPTPSPRRTEGILRQRRHVALDVVFFDTDRNLFATHAPQDDPLFLNSRAVRIHHTVGAPVHLHMHSCVAAGVAMATALLQLSHSARVSGGIWRSPDREAGPAAPGRRGRTPYETPSDLH